MTTILSRTEILFWKIIRNKVLFREIFSIISNNSLWIKSTYTNPNQIRIDNIIKFKDITSLEWMVKNNQFALLKCKLNAGESIEMKSQGIKQLFKCVSNSELVMESLELILKYNLLELIQYDLIKEAIYCSNLGCVKILLGHKEFNTVYPSTLEYVIKNSNVGMLDTLINTLGNNTLISNEIKINSLLLANENTLHRKEMFKFILNDPRLYCTVSTITNDIQMTFNDDVEFDNGHINEFKERLIYSIINCDVSSLKEIYNTQTIIEFESETSSEPIFNSESVNHFINQPIDNIIEFSRVLNENGFKYFDGKLFKEYFKLLLSISDDNFSKFNLSNVIFNFNKLQSKQHVKKLLSFCSPRIIQLILKSNGLYNILKVLQYKFTRFNPIEINITNNENIELKCKYITSNIFINNINGIMESIQLLVNHFNVECSNVKDNGIDGIRGNEDLNLLIECINFHFLKLISIGGNLPIGKLKSIYQLINNNKYSIELNHTLYHSIFYIAISSTETLKYILKYPFSLVKAYPTNNNNVLEIKSYLQTFIDPNKYTFGFIFGNEIKKTDDLMQMVIEDMSDTPTSLECATYFRHTEIFQYNLLYFLEINKEDWFFHILECYQNVVNDYYENGMGQATFAPYFNLGVYNCFKFTDSLIIGADMVLNEESFQKFILFNCYKEKNRSPIEYYLSNDIHLSKNPKVVNVFLKHYKFINEVCGDSWRVILRGIDEWLILKYQHLFFKNNNNNNNQENQGISLKRPLDTLISRCPINSITLSNLLIYDFPSRFSHSKQEIAHLIRRDKMNYLKYYYDNGEYTNENQLLQHLKLKLSIHNEYKYVNWCGDLNDRKL